jgi:hypothetical protein
MANHADDPDRNVSNTFELLRPVITTIEHGLLDAQGISVGFHISYRVGQPVFRQISRSDCRHDVHGNLVCPACRKKDEVGTRFHGGDCGFAI